MSQWHVVYHNGTSSKQCAIYNLLFGIMDKWSNKTDFLMIVLSCIVIVDGSAEGIKEEINSKV